MEPNLPRKLEKIFNKCIVSNQINEAVLFVQNTSGDFSYSKGYGGQDIDSPLLMASITKLLTTTCIFVLQEQGKLLLNDKIKSYLDHSVLDGLHVYQNQQYSFDLTVADLLFQISGLPDVYEEGSNSMKNRVMKEDFSYTFYETIEMTKKLSPHFKPRASKKAYYSDINFDLLGKIIETITAKPLNELYRQLIFDPLGLKNTYLPKSETDLVPAIYSKNKPISRPLFVTSSGASGGCISTARELMIFSKSFFSGRLFNSAIFDQLSSYNMLQSSMRPICYGSGYMRIPLNGLISAFLAKGELIGHSGSTGSFAFFYPDKDVFMTGNLNQMDDPALPVKLSMRIAMCRG